MQSLRAASKISGHHLQELLTSDLYAKKNRSEYLEVSESRVAFFFFFFINLERLTIISAAIPTTAAATTTTAITIGDAVGSLFSRSASKCNNVEFPRVYMLTRGFRAVRSRFERMSW